MNRRVELDLNMKKFLKFAPVLAAVALMGQGCIIQFNNAGSSDGGVWRSANKGTDWVQKNGVLSVGGARNMNTANILNFVSDPNDPLTVYVATDANGILFTTDGGESWSQPKDLGSAKISGMALDHKDKCKVYVVTGGMAVKTTDCTRTWSKIYEESRAGVTIASIVVDYFNANNVYLATTKGDVIKSTDAGTSWATVTAKPFNSAIVKLVMDPFDSRIIYAGTKSDGIWKTIDSGATWVDMTAGLAQFDGAKDLYDLVPDTSKQNSYVLVCRYGLLRTSDSAASWTKIPLVTGPGQARIYGMAMNPANGQEMYYSTATVFYKTLNGGSNWTTKRLPTSRIGSAVIVSGKDSSIIYLGTLQVKK
jgi:photosystem II stability/assembly factor-like uncharacterized protein